jgi:hypothetical protein
MGHQRGPGELRFIAGDLGLPQPISAKLLIIRPSLTHLEIAEDKKNGWWPAEDANQSPDTGITAVGKSVGKGCLCTQARISIAAS